MLTAPEPAADQVLGDHLICTFQNMKPDDMQCGNWFLPVLLQHACLHRAGTLLVSVILARPDPGFAGLLMGAVIIRVCSLAWCINCIL
jgi:hypothetical protein